MAVYYILQHLSLIVVKISTDKEPKMLAKNFSEDNIARSGGHGAV